MDLKIEFDKLAVGGTFWMVDVSKATPNSAYQYATRVIGNRAYRTCLVKVTWVEDRGEYLYIGYRPVGPNAHRFGRFGATRLYKKNDKPFGTLGFTTMKHPMEEGVLA